MKVIVTKYALTSGITVEDAELDEKFKDLVLVRQPKYLVYLHKPDWHTSKEEAGKQVRAMANRKRASLTKQLDGIANKTCDALRVIEEAQL